MYQNYANEKGSPDLTFWDFVSGYKQVPFIKSNRPPLPYYKQGVELLGCNSWGSIAGRCGYSLWGEITPGHHQLNFPTFNGGVEFSDVGNEAYAKAYAKFQSKAYTQAATLTALAERRKTFDMVVARLAQLAKGAKALKQGRFKEFLNTFGIRPHKMDEHRTWTRPSQFGKLWLEYWMGWAPTVGDVFNAITALSSPIPDKTIRGGARLAFSREFSQSNGAEALATSSYSGYCFVHISGTVEITNPMLHMASTVGLANPAKTLWETTGFSWFADWFTNVGQCLGQFTDWVGLKLRDCCVSIKTLATSNYKCEGARWIFDNVPETLEREREFWWFSRTPVETLPLMRPILRLPNGLSPSRGATLCSLLVTIFAPEWRWITFPNGVRRNG